VWGKWQSIATRRKGAAWTDEGQYGWRRVEESKNGDLGRSILNGDIDGHTEDRQVVVGYRF